MPEWTLIYDNTLTGVRTYEQELADGVTLEKREFYAVEPFIEANKALLAETAGQRFDDMQLVARIPMHAWANQFAEPIKEGDWKWLKRELNNPENRAFRTFRGRV